MSPNTHTPVVTEQGIPQGTLRPARSEEITAHTSLIIKQSNWEYVYDMAMKLHGPATQKVDITYIGEHNDDGGINHFVSTIDAFDINGNMLPYDRSSSFWDEWKFSPHGGMEARSARTDFQEWLKDKEYEEEEETDDELDDVFQEYIEDNYWDLRNHFELPAYDSEDTQYYDLTTSPFDLYGMPVFYVLEPVAPMTHNEYIIQLLDKKGREIGIDLSDYYVYANCINPIVPVLAETWLDGDTVYIQIGLSSHHDPNGACTYVVVPDIMNEQTMNHLGLIFLSGPDK